MTIDEFFSNVVAAVTKDDSSEMEVLGLMIVLHNCMLHIDPRHVLTDAVHATALAPITRRHVAEVVAERWDETDYPRSEPTYWYDLYATEAGFEFMWEVDSRFQLYVDCMSHRILESGLVVRLEADD